MKLEQQVTSKELSERLAKLGVKQESYFWWYKLNGEDSWVVYPLNKSGNETYSAFTVAELLKLLDEEITIPKVENVAEYLGEKLCQKLK